MPLTGKDSVGKWVKDFRKSDAPQFKGKSPKKRQQMAVAAALDAKQNNEDTFDALRHKYIDSGISDLKSRISSLEYEPETQPFPERPEGLSEEERAERAAQFLERGIKTYKEVINPGAFVKEEEEVKEVPNTKASTEAIKARAKQMAGMRNGGNEGKYSPAAGNNGGNSTNSIGSNVGLFPCTLTIEEYEEHIRSLFETPEEVEEVITETEEYIYIDESKAVEELEEELLRLEDTSWVSIDKLMRSICKEHNISPKELHNDFKDKHGMIPDDWISTQNFTEDCGWYPLDEAIRHINQTGQVYDVTYIAYGKTHRVKFFWPQTRKPSKQDMQKEVEKFFPKAKLLAFYPSMEHCSNTMVMVSPMREFFNPMQEEDWGFMSEEATEVYEMICAEEGEPITPPYLNESGHYEMVIEDHDTGEARVMTFTEGDEMKGLSVKSGHKRSVDQGAGLTQKGVDAINRKTGGNLKTAVTTPPSKLKPGSKAAKRRKSFCARSRSWNGERGKAARRRWNC